MTETQLTRHITDALRARGCWVRKLYGGSMQGAGLPDLIVVHASGTWFMEVKLPGGQPTRLQQHVMERIKSAGGKACVVRSVEDAVERIDARRQTG